MSHMAATLVVILILAVFVIGLFVVVQDIDELCEKQLACTGCQRHFVKRGCPVHDNARKAA